MALKLDPRRGIVRIGGCEVAEVPDAGGVVEGSGEDVLGQRLELDQLQGKETLELLSNKKPCRIFSSNEVCSHPL